MKTSSSKLFRGLMFIAALAVPATTWWYSVHYYNAHKQPEETVASAPVPAPEQKRKEQRDVLLSKVKEGSTIEAMTELRKVWTGPTDPDSVWRGQMREANETLMQHDLPALNASHSPRPPSTRRLRFR
ncbi:hypothetical protein [Prosthecobacter sp.]|uniref:hypothetical protein n=1 Tax=Prosthecobacter sp. TaxID=1965333 RepID=UPI0037851ECA